MAVLGVDWAKMEKMLLDAYKESIASLLKEPSHLATKHFITADLFNPKTPHAMALLQSLQVPHGSKVVEVVQHIDKLNTFDVYIEMPNGVVLLYEVSPPLGPEWHWNTETVKSVLIKMVVKGKIVEPSDYFWEKIGE